MSSKLKILFLLMFLMGCPSHHQKEEVKAIEASAFPKDIAIPKAFIQMIEADLANESKILNPVYIFVPIKVLFSEKSEDTLTSSRLEYVFPKGGGQLDLQNIATGQGTFYVSFPPEQFHDLPELEHLFYVSQSPVTKIDGENFGLGCGKWIDLKRKFLDFQKPNFIKVNTTSNRHTHVLAGSYIFVFRKLNQIFLTQLTLSHSKIENQLCPKLTGDPI